MVPGLPFALIHTRQFGGGRGERGLRVQMPMVVDDLLSWHQPIGYMWGKGKAVCNAARLTNSPLRPI